MTRAVTLANLADTNIFTVDGANDRVGIGTTQPTEKLEVVGVVSATSFFGDGSNLEGVASAGLGTALSDVDTDANSVIYFTNTTLGIGSTVIVDPPSTTNVAYTQYQEVSLDADVDLIVAEGDDFVPDILGLGENSMTFGIRGGGSSGGSSSGISAVVEDVTPQLGGNLDLNSKTINGNGNINITGTISGDGSGLTNLSGVGAGIGVSNSGTAVGTAQTINFGSGISISAVNAGFATVTVSAGSTADVSTSTLNVTGVSTFAGDITPNGAINFGGTSNLTLGDNNSLHVGTGNDLRILHSGGDSIIRHDTTDGEFALLTTNEVRITNSGFAKTAAIFKPTAETQLYHNHSKKLETTGYGVTVTGIVSATSYRGDGSQLTGVGAASTADVSTSTLNVVGVSTLTGKVGVGTISAGNANLAVVSATQAAFSIGQNVDGSGVNHLGMYYASAGGGGADVFTSNGDLSFWVDGAGGSGSQIEFGNGFGPGAGGATWMTITSSQLSITGIASASTHVSSGIVTYYGDSSYSAAGRWVLGASGSSHYTFTGPGLGHSTLNDPTLYLMRGQTYMFENKMSAHPFRIQSTSNGSTGTQWNVGVTNNDVSNGVLIFEVPFVCPNTLYYQCTAHANMGGVLNIVT